MKLKYLGTAAAEGWPAVFCNCSSCQKARALGGKNVRTRSQAVVDGELMLDLPCDTYLHVLREGLDLSAVRWLLVTHSHTDHFYPAELVLRGGCYGREMTSSTLDIYCNETVENYFYKAARHELEPDIEKNLRFHRAVPFESFQAGPYRITPLPARHMTSEQALIYLIEKNGRSMLYAHDTGRFLPEVYLFLQNKHLDLISLDCTSGRIENGASDGHMGLPDAVQVRDQLLDIDAADSHTRFILNHFSHNGGLLHDQLVELAAGWHMEPAYDGAVVEIGE